MDLELKENRPHGTKEYPYCQYHMHEIRHDFQIPVITTGQEVLFFW